jgi:hypothetical protein
MFIEVKLASWSLTQVSVALKVSSCSSAIITTFLGYFAPLNQLSLTLCMTQNSQMYEQRSPPSEASSCLATHNFLSFHETRKFITQLTKSRHLSLSSARPIQSTRLQIHFNIILQSTATSTPPSGSFLQFYPPKPCNIYILRYSCHMPCPSHFPCFDHPSVW